VPCRGGEDLVRRLFEPLGYRVETTPIALDERFTAWGDSRYLDLRIDATVPVRDLLRHLYVLLPVMDDDKHYWVERGEIEKLLSRGEDWLGTHPERDLITRRYLRHRAPLTREALARLLEEDQGRRVAAIEEVLHPRTLAEVSVTTNGSEWRRADSNRRPPACKAGALPAELRPPVPRGAVGRASYVDALGISVQDPSASFLRSAL
jgi:hypothetical protein